MKRVVEPELLDTLPADDPAALRSRRDLRRLNHIMHHADLFCAALLRHLDAPPKHIVDIGAGEGHLMLKLAERLHRLWPSVTVTLVDCKPVVSNDTLARFSGFGWRAEPVVADVFAWLPQAPRAEVYLANLFLHQFVSEDLVRLFQTIVTRTDLLVACETRRNFASRISSRFVGFVGCGPVTRYDSVKSVQAGFAGTELSALWPARDGWQLSERRAKLFTHEFVARRCVS